jgi:CRISPR-associated protein Cas2
MKLLKGYGFHVQKSVFECYLDAAQLEKLQKRLQREMNPETDSIRIYAMTLAAVQQVRILGKGEVNELLHLMVI